MHNIKNIRANFENFKNKLKNRNVNIDLNNIIIYPEEFGFACCLSTHFIVFKPWEYFLLPIRQRIS